MTDFNTDLNQENLPVAPSGKLGLLKEFLQFLNETKKWWIAPILIFMILLGILIVFTQGSTVAPLIYTIF